MTDGPLVHTNLLPAELGESLCQTALLQVLNESRRGIPLAIHIWQRREKGFGAAYTALAPAMDLNQNPFAVPVQAVVLAGWALRGLGLSIRLDKVMITVIMHLDGFKVRQVQEIAQLADSLYLAERPSWKPKYLGVEALDHSLAKAIEGLRISFHESDIPHSVPDILFKNPQSNLLIGKG